MTPVMILAAAYAVKMPAAPKNRSAINANGTYMTIMRPTLMCTAGIGLPMPLKDAFITITIP